MLQLFKRKSKATEPQKSEAPSTSESTTTTTLETADTKKNFFSRLTDGLKRTRASFSNSLATLFIGKKTIDKELLQQLESILLSADVGVNTTNTIINKLTEKCNRSELKDADSLLTLLKQILQEILEPYAKPLAITANELPFVILVIGVNGAGKTTSIGKLAYQLQQQGASVLLAAGDTFRAAAIEQLQVWGERNKIPVIAQQAGSDAASVIFDAMQAATSRKIDVLIADTAGRLHTQDNLMEELKKIKRVLSKIDINAPQEVLLILDASIGQNAINQAQKFHEALGVTGIAITKLDGTAKGGAIFALAEKLQLPIRFIGVGESLEDFRPFDAHDFIEALFN